MRSQPRPSVYDLAFDTIADATDLTTATHVYQQLYDQRRASARELDRVRAILDVADTAPLRRVRTTPGRMSTKVLFALPDGNAIEAVRIRRRTGMTACVLSQVGLRSGARSAPPASSACNAICESARSSSRSSSSARR